MVTSSAVVGSSAMSRRGTQDVRNGTTHPLPHPAAELMRIVAESRGSAPGCAAVSVLPGPAARSVAPRTPWCKPHHLGHLGAQSSGPGLRDVIGSCSTMAICLPRTRRISVGLLRSRSSPAKSTCPPTIRPAGSGTSRTRDRQVTDFPEPDSPTSASVSPALRVKLTPSTALTTPRRV